MEQIIPISRSQERIIDGTGKRKYRCFAPHNPHYYMQNGVLVPINVLAKDLSVITTGKMTADIRGNHVVSVGLNKAGSYEKFIGFRHDDKQDGAEQFEVSYLGAQFNDVSVSADASSKATLTSLVDRIGNLQIFSCRQRTRLAVPATSSVDKFCVRYRINTVGLTAKETNGEYSFLDKNGKVRFKIGRPRLLNPDFSVYYEDEETVGPYPGYIQHSLDELSDGSYLYTKMSTDKYRRLPNDFLIDANIVYANTDDRCLGYLDSASWSTTRGASTANYTRDADEDAYNYAIRTTKVNVPDTYRIHRTFFAFDTSGIKGEITSCSMNLYVTYDNGGNICVQQGTQSSPVVEDDYNNFTGVYYAYIGDVTTSQYNELVFNSTGISGVNQEGNTLIAAREYNHDYLNSAPGTDTTYITGCRFADYVNTDYDPYLSIEAKSLFTPRIIAVC
jgi:hypothetical protein